MLDVIIIGAGPAGISSSIACAENGLKVEIYDEFIKPGGRLLGQLHQEPSGEWWNGIIEAEALVSKSKELGVTICCGVSVSDIRRMEDGWSIHTNIGMKKAKALILATGAAEFPVPIPGWSLPGVMSIGAAQVMTNVHRVRVGNEGVIIGANVLAFAILNELQMAGIKIKSVILPEKNLVTDQYATPKIVMDALLNFAHLAPSPLLKMGSKFMVSGSLKQLGLNLYPTKGFNINGTRLQLKKCVTEIVGTHQVEGIKTAKIDNNGDIVQGTEAFIKADFVCIAGGLYPLAELAAVAGCNFTWIPELGGHIPVHNKEMHTTEEGLFVAGNITGVESAKVAKAQGTVAGLSVCKRILKAESLDKPLKQAVQAVETIRANAIIQFNSNIKQGRDKVEQIFNEHTELIPQEPQNVTKRLVH